MSPGGPAPVRPRLERRCTRRPTRIDVSVQTANHIAQAHASSVDHVAKGRLLFRRVAAEDYILLPEDETFDIVFAVRLGALDGRHPELAATTPRTDPVAAIGPGWRLRAPGKSCLACGLQQQR